MAKKDPKEAYRAFLGDVPTADKRSTSDTPTTHQSSTNAVQTTHKQSTMKRYDVRMDPADWAALGRAAAAEGSSRGAIIRRLVKGFLH